MRVAVIGLGTVGSMTLWQLASKGVEVVGFEQFGIGHDYAAAGGESRLFRTAYGEGSSYTPLMLASRLLWRQLEEETNQSLLALCGGLMIGHPTSHFMQNVLESAEKFQLKTDVYEADIAQDHYPQHPLLNDEIMIKDYAAGYLRPELAVVSAVKKAEELGAKVLPYTKVDELKQNQDSVTIYASGESYHFDRVIVTTGPWTGRFLPEYPSSIAVKRLAMGWFPAKDIEKFKPENYPIVIRESKEDKFYSAPTLEGSMVKVAAYGNYGIVDNPDQLNRTILPGDLIKLRKMVQKYLPDLHPNPVRVGVYMDGFTKDEHGVLGYIDDTKQIIVSSGFSGHGFKLAPIFGKITATIAMDQQVDKQFNLQQFNPSRFM